MLITNLYSYYIAFSLIKTDRITFINELLSLLTLRVKMIFGPKVSTPIINLRNTRFKKNVFTC